MEADIRHVNGPVPSILVVVGGGGGEWEFTISSDSMKNVCLYQPHSIQGGGEIREKIAQKGLKSLKITSFWVVTLDIFSQHLI